jgi:5-methylcytosine-specific restriction endonuclease McrA
MPTPVNALEQFILILGAQHNGDARRQVSLGAGDLVYASKLDFYRTQDQLDAHDSTPFVDQAALTAVFHLFWHLIPNRLFQPLEPDYRRLADRWLEHSGVLPTSPDLSRALALIYKRLRGQWFDGRDATSLDLSRADHQALLDSQAGRCAVCGYRFQQADVDLYLEDEYVLARVELPVAPHELVLPKIVRSPVLDHILPQFIGGDDHSNWQILCGSCNNGKGDVWSAASSALAAPRTPHHVTALTPSLRYLTLVNRINSQGLPQAQLHVRKKDPAGIITLRNLIAVETAELTR